MRSAALRVGEAWGMASRVSVGSGGSGGGELGSDSSSFICCGSTITQLLKVSKVTQKVSTNITTYSLGRDIKHTFMIFAWHGSSSIGP